MDNVNETCLAAVAPMRQHVDGEKAFLGAVLDRGVADVIHL